MEMLDTRFLRFDRFNEDGVRPDPLRREPDAPTIRAHAGSVIQPLGRDDRVAAHEAHEVRATAPAHHAYREASTQSRRARAPISCAAHPPRPRALRGDVLRRGETAGLVVEEAPTEIGVERCRIVGVAYRHRGHRAERDCQSASRARRQAEHVGVARGVGTELAEQLERGMWPGTGGPFDRQGRTLKHPRLANVHRVTDARAIQAENDRVQVRDHTERDGSRADTFPLARRARRHLGWRWRQCGRREDRDGAPFLLARRVHAAFRGCFVGGFHRQSVRFGGLEISQITRRPSKRRTTVGFQP